MNQAVPMPAALLPPVGKAAGAGKEIELKLLVAPEDVRRVLRHPALMAAKRGRSRRAKFQAFYYDTPDCALERAQLALRVRREGARWVQTVKGRGTSAAGLHARDEFEWPLMAQRLNLDVLAASPFAKIFAREDVRGGLQALFTTEFERTTLALELGAGVQAELAVDQGLIRAGRHTTPISEIELEMKAGEAGAAFRLALAVQASVPLTLGHRSKAERGYALARGAVDTPQKAKAVELDETLDAGDALRRIAWRCIAQMQANEAGTLDGRDPEFLHQLRVGLRRLRSCLALARAPIVASSHPDLLEELRSLQNALGPARDWDVFATETLPPIVARFQGAQGQATSSSTTGDHRDGEATPAAPGDASGLAGLRVRAGQLRRAHGRAAAEVLRSPRYPRLLLTLGLALCDDTLDAKGEETAWLDTPVEKYAIEVLAQRHKKLKKRGAHLATATPEERHAARIAGKKLRYAAEFFSPLFGKKKTRRYTAALSGLQDSLGALNDASVTERLLAEVVAAGKSRPDPTAIALVRGWVAGAAHQRLGELSDRWVEFVDCTPFWN
jgi:inorganic triphosphatase YgiF